MSSIPRWWTPLHLRDSMFGMLVAVLWLTSVPMHGQEPNCAARLLDDRGNPVKGALVWKLTDKVTLVPQYTDNPTQLFQFTNDDGSFMYYGERTGTPTRIVVREPGSSLVRTGTAICSWKPHLVAVQLEPLTANVAELRLAESKLSERLTAATVVVSGTIAKTTPMRQHPDPDPNDPQWEEAILTVESVEKGDVHDKTLTFLIPTAVNPKWYRSPGPELWEGFHVILLLHMQQPDRWGITTPSLVATDFIDSQPITAKAEIIRLLKKGKKN